MPSTPQESQTPAVKKKPKEGIRERNVMSLVGIVMSGCAVRQTLNIRAPPSAGPVSIDEGPGDELGRSRAQKAQQCLETGNRVGDRVCHRVAS